MVIRGAGLAAFIVFLALCLAVAYETIRLVQDQRFNDALTAGEIPSTNDRDAYRRFAEAYELQQQQKFKAAVTAYAGIDAPPPGRLRTDIKYNLGNLYFREALRLRETGAPDLAMPLIELAKQNYREVLRADAHYWDAKYNLELAVIVAPETDPVDPLEEVNPERSPRALTTIQSKEPLP